VVGSLTLPSFSAQALAEVPMKRAVIHLRWPLVIIVSYFLLYSLSDRASPALVYGFLPFYILSNCTLYFVDEEVFSSTYFNVSLVVFDTFFLILSLTLSQKAGPDFYIAIFLTIFLCAICRDFRGLIGIAVLTPLLYGYMVFQPAQLSDPVFYLRITFPFVVALFYGYFAQVERLQEALEEKSQQESERRKTREEIQRNLKQVRAFKEISTAIASDLDLRSILDALQEKVDFLLPSPATAVWLFDRKSGEIELVASKNIDEEAWRAYRWKGRGYTTAVFKSGAPVLVKDLPADRRTWNPGFFREHGLVSFLGVPLVAKGEVVGVFSFYTREEHEFTSEEIDFLTTLSAQAAIAVHNYQLYEETKRQAAEASGRSREDFLKIITDELRNPLAVIVGYTNLVGEGLLGEVNADQKGALRRVMGQSYDLLAMIDGMLRAAEIEGGTALIQWQDVDLGQFLEELRSTYDMPPDKDRTLAWDYSSGLPVIRTDGGKLRQILKNLIDNGVKFTRQGTVTVSVKIAPAGGQGAAGAGEMVEFKVADTGIGMAKEEIPIIFEVFRQRDSSEKRPHTGIGLGLYVAKKFTEMLGGKIDVESEPGKGSVFTVAIPLAQTAPTPSRQQ